MRSSTAKKTFSLRILMTEMNKYSDEGQEVCASTLSNFLTHLLRRRRRGRAVISMRLFVPLKRWRRQEGEGRRLHVPTKRRRLPRTRTGIVRRIWHSRG